MRANVGIWLLILCASVLFVLWPQLDIWVSHLFFTDTDRDFRGAGFIAHRHGDLIAFREVLKAIPLLLALGVALLGTIGFFAPHLRLVTPRAAVFLLSSVLLGPVLLVNVWFKEFWGRARPLQISEFGGSREFTPVWTFSDQCASNCSFASGEVAGASWTLAFVLLVPPAWRSLTLAVSLGYVTLIALLRVSAGAHFLSDVLVSVVVTQVCTLSLYMLFYPQAHPGAARG